MAVSLAGKTALVTGATLTNPIAAVLAGACKDRCCGATGLKAVLALYTGSTQGIGFGMLKALAGAGADVVMHGLVAQDELDQKTKALKEEYGVKVGHSAANVRKPQEIRSVPLLMLFFC